MDRRTLLLAAGTAGASLFGGLVSDLPARLRSGDVRALAGSVETLRALGRQTGGYVPGLAALAERGEALGRLPAAEQTRMACLRVATEAWTVAGWTAADAGKRATAWGHYDRALGLTETTGDAGAATRVLYFTGTLESDAGRFNQALRLYQLAGIRALDAKGPTVGRMLDAPTAYAYAAIGRGDLARDYVHRAQDATEDDFLRANALTWVADAQALMGRLDDAVDTAKSAAVMFPPGSQRAAVLAELTVAEVHRRGGDSRADDLIAGLRERIGRLASVLARQRLLAIDGLLPA